LNRFEKERVVNTDIGTTLSVNIFLASAPVLESIPNLLSLANVAWLTVSAEDMKENPDLRFLR
jgi:predicted nucleotidyltransferase